LGDLYVFSFQIAQRRLFFKKIGVYWPLTLKFLTTIAEKTRKEVGNRENGLWILWLEKYNLPKRKDLIKNLFSKMVKSRVSRRDVKINRIDVKVLERV